MNRNCIDFTRRVVAASGITTDYRGSFFTGQYIELVGIANAYSLLESSSPTVYPATSLSQKGLIDEIGREYIVRPLGVASVVAAGYLTYKGLKKGITLAGRTIERIGKTFKCCTKPCQSSKKEKGAVLQKLSLGKMVT